MENPEIITEKDHPISAKWLIKWGPIILLGFLIYSFIKIKPNEDFGAMLNFSFVASSLIFLYVVIYRMTLRYRFGEDGFYIKKGVFSTAEKNVPYARIQNIVVSNDWMDNFLGIADLSIETASKGKEASKIFGLTSSNRIVIPGLDSGDAEYIKNFVLERMKENPMVEGQAGL